MTTVSATEENEIITIPNAHFFNNSFSISEKKEKQPAK